MRIRSTIRRGSFGPSKIIEVPETIETGEVPAELKRRNEGAEVEHAGYDESNEPIHSELLRERLLRRE